MESLHTTLGRGEPVIAAPASTSAAVASVDADGQMPCAALRDERDLARELASMLDRAMQRDQWEFADRIAQSAARLTRDHAILAERLARLRAAQCDFDTAVTILDSCAAQSASMRLLRAVCLLQLGRRHEAHLDLHEWAKKSAAPLHARLVLALLEHQEGDHDAATQALQRNLRQIEDPQTLAALMLIAVSNGRMAVARTWADRLRLALTSAESPTVFEIMLASCGFAQREGRLPDSPIAAATLATELIGNEHVVPALVEAERLHNDAASARLLVAALEQVVDELADPRAGCVALADLNDMLGAHDVGVAWRGRAQRLAAQRDDVVASIGRDGTIRLSRGRADNATVHDRQVAERMEQAA